MSRAMMALFYLATLAGLIVVSGAGPDPTVADEVIDPITVAARHPVETVGGVDLVEQD